MRRTTRCTRVFLALTLIESLILTGCGPAKQSEQTQTIKIGVVMPLTGGAASYGRACLNGMELAIDAYNANKSAEVGSVKLVIEDDQADPTKAVSAFQKLVSADNVGAVLGPLSSGATLAVAPLAERSRVPILSPAGSAPAITNAGDYVFRNELSEAYGAKAQAELAIKPLGFKSIALLYVNNEYGAGTAQVFRERYLHLRGKIVAEEAYPQGTSDFRTALVRIKVAHPDALFVVFQDEIVNIVKQKSELSVPGKIFTTAIVEDTTFLSALGPLADGIIYTHYGSFDNAATNGTAGEFSEAYSARFNESPSYFAALGYDAASILLKALTDSGGKPQGIKDSLYNIQHFPGVTGETSFDKNGDVIKPVILKIFRAGRPELYNL